MASTDQNNIELAFKKAAKEFGEAAAKHFTANMAVNQSGYTETASRGGAITTDPSLPKGGGKVNSAIELDQAVMDVAREIQKRSRGIGSKFWDGIAGAMDVAREISQKGMKDFLGDRMLDRVVRDAEEFSKRFKGATRQLIDEQISYVRQNGTNLRELSKVTNALSDYNETLHDLSNGVEGAGEKFKQTIAALDDDTRKDLEGVRKLWNQYPEEIKESILKSIDIVQVVPPKDATDEVKQAYNDAQKQLREMSIEVDNTATALSDATGMMVNNIEANISSHNARMKMLFKAMMVAGGVGTSNLFEDSLRRYQYNLSETFYGAAINMGMAHSDLQRAVMDYRDVLRYEAISAEGEIYSGDFFKHDGMDRIRDNQNLGKIFGLIGTEGLQFGMRLRETAKLMGLQKPDTSGMQDFYRDAAKMMNMSVMEFGDFFNDMAKDPAFANWANTLRTIGDESQKAMLKEMQSRIRMNKILGLGNEELQKRLNLENAKKWAPLAEKYTAAAMMKSMQHLIVRELGSGFSLSTDDMNLLDDYLKSPELLSEPEKTRAQELQTHFLSAYTAISSKYRAERAAATTDQEKENVFARYGPVLEQMRQFGTRMGKEFYDPEQIDKFGAHVASLGIEPKELRDAVIEGANDTTGRLDEIIKIITGEAEEGPGEPNALERTWMFGKEKLGGAAQNPVMQALTGVAGAIGGFVWEIAKIRIAVAGLGLGAAGGGILARIGGKLGGKFAVKAAALFAGSGVISKLLRFGAGEELAKTVIKAGQKAAPEVAKAAAAKTAKAAAVKGAKNIAAQEAIQQGGKKLLLKKLPILGAMLSGGYAIDRAIDGDWLGAGGELLSGILSIFPVIGTAASFAVDGALIAKDVAEINREVANAQDEYKPQASPTPEYQNVKMATDNAATELKRIREEVANMAEAELGPEDPQAQLIEKLNKSNELLEEQLNVKKSEVKGNEIKYNESKTTTERLAKMQEQALASSVNWRTMVSTERSSAAAQYT